MGRDDAQEHWTVDQPREARHRLKRIREPQRLASTRPLVDHQIVKYTRVRIHTLKTLTRNTLAWRSYENKLIRNKTRPHR